MVLLPKVSLGGVYQITTGSSTSFRRVPGTASDLNSSYSTLSGPWWAGLPWCP